MTSKDHSGETQSGGEPRVETGPASGAAPGKPRTGKALFDATRPFAVESPLRSWWAVWSTLVPLVASIAVAAAAPWWPLRLAAAVLGGLLLVRSFILYHDFMHKALLRRSRIAGPVFQLLGLFLLAPSRYWRHSHNYHHGNVGKPLETDDGPELLMTSDLGSFPLMTTETWRSTSFWQRLRYRVNRHAVTLVCAYVTVFLFSLTLVPFVKSPREYWDGAVALLAHAALVAAIWVFAGFGVLFFALLLPVSIASAIGAYIFYAQHNYEGMHILEPEEWTYYRGAIESSSYLRLDPVIDWFTANIGYHHVHHLNPLIPFYRLPETVAAVPELLEAATTSLRPRDIRECLRLNLWDVQRGHLVSYAEARDVV